MTHTDSTAVGSSPVATKIPSAEERRRRRIANGGAQYTERELAKKKRKAQRRCARRYAERRAVIDGAKTAKGCADCGYREHACVLDFHHPPGTVKVSTVSRMTLWCPLPILLAEIEKCEVVCANCHRLRTHLGREREQSVDQYPVLHPEFRAKLTEAQVETILRSFIAGSNIEELAAGNNVTHCTIRVILRGQRWQHVCPELRSEARQRLLDGLYQGKSRLSVDDVQEIRRCRANGERVLDLSTRFGVSRATIDNVISQKTWKHVR